MDERYVEGGKRLMARRDEDSQGERIRHPEDADPEVWRERQADETVELQELGGEAGGA